MAADEEARLLAELRRLRSPEHRATYVNHIGPAWTARRIITIERRLSVIRDQ